MKQLSFFVVDENQTAKEVYSIVLQAEEWGEQAVSFSTFPKDIDEKFITFVHGKNNVFELGKKYKITIEEIDDER